MRIMSRVMQQLFLLSECGIIYKMQPSKAESKSYFRSISALVRVLVLPTASPLDIGTPMPLLVYKSLLIAGMSYNSL